jgi:hypothetical protein
LLYIPKSNTVNPTHLWRNIETIPYLSFSLLSFVEQLLTFQHKFFLLLLLMRVHEPVLAFGRDMLQINLLSLYDPLILERFDNVLKETGDCL